LKRPYFTVGLTTANCDYEVRLNDVPLDSGDGSVATEIPANQWVVTGENVLELTVRTAAPGAGPAARCRATLYQREIEASCDTRAPLADLAFGAGPGEGGFEGSGGFPGVAPPRVVEVRPGMARAQRSVALTTPFPAWVWLGAQELAEDEATRDSLLEEYRRFWFVLSQGAGPAVDAAMEVNGREIQAAYYLETLDAALEQLEIRGLLSDPATRLEPLATRGLVLEVFGRKRLAQLVGPDRRSPIVFRESGQAVRIGAIYCRTRKGWVMAR
jgi:hypothetical protein